MHDGHTESAATNEITVRMVRNETDAAVTAAVHETCNDLANRKNTRATYSVTLGGVLQDTKVVDTTGAGDAFIAGYLVATLLSYTVGTCLRLGAWVSGQKLRGSGAQTALPTANEFDCSLGRTKHAAESALQDLILPRHSIKPV